ncbi:hypothetical protein Tco_0062607, partial [Tanacetum coccineum]
VNNVTTAGPKAVVSAAEGNGENAVKSSSWHMTRNKSFLTDYQEIDGGFVAFAGSAKGGKLTGKGTKANIDEGQGGMKTVPGPQYVLLPFLTSDSQSLKSSEDEVADDAGKKIKFWIQQKKMTKAVKGRLLTLTVLTDIILLVHQLILVV